MTNTALVCKEKHDGACTSQHAGVRYTEYTSHLRQQGACRGPALLIASGRAAECTPIPGQWSSVPSVPDLRQSSHVDWCRGVCSFSSQSSSTVSLFRVCSPSIFERQSRQLLALSFTLVLSLGICLAQKAIWYKPVCPLMACRHCIVIRSKCTMTPVKCHSLRDSTH